MSTETPVVTGSPAFAGDDDHARAAATGRMPLFSRALPAWLQALPLALVFAIFFLIPLALTVMVSFWDYTEYSLVPAFTLRSYSEMFEGCYDKLPELCVTLKTYLSTLKFCLSVWLIALVVGFFIAYFLAFHVRTTTMQVTLFLVCTVPFWTSNVIRTISWIPLLGRNGLINYRAGQGAHHRGADRVADLLRLLGDRRAGAPLHAVHDRSDLQLDDADRPRADRGRA